MGRNCSQKIAAFTIFETLIALILSGLVILFAYSGIQLIGNYFTQQQEVQAVKDQEHLFHSLLEKDIQFAQSISLQADTFWMNFEKGSSVRYELRDSSLHRVQAQVLDTFPLLKNQIEFKTLSNNMEGQGKTQLVSSIRLLDDSLKVLTLRKKYTAAVLYHWERHGN